MPYHINTGFFFSPVLFLAKKRYNSCNQAKIILKITFIANYNSIKAVPFSAHGRLKV